MGGVGGILHDEGQRVEAIRFQEECWIGEKGTTRHQPNGFDPVDRFATVSIEGTAKSECSKITKVRFLNSQSLYMVCERTTDLKTNKPIDQGGGDLY